MYVDKVLNQLKKQLCNENPDNNEFYQAVEEVFESLRPVLTAEHEKMKVLERFTIPEQSHKFKILWEDDNGEVQINTGYRIQYNSILGVYNIYTTNKVSSLQSQLNNTSYNKTTNLLVA